MKEIKFTVLSGDGIGPEVMNEALKVLKKIANISNLNLNYREHLVGGAALDAVDHPLPEDTLKACEDSNAILFGSVGGPKWENLPAEKQPERGALLPLRKHFGLFANLRPSICYKALAHASPLKNEIVGDGFDVLCVRELTGGIYFGSPKELKKSDVDNSKKMAIDTMVYHEYEIERIAELAFESAMKRSKKLCSIDKANVLQNGVLWREIVEKISKKYPKVKVENLYVDNAAMQLLRRPRDFDVILAPNLFGDILSDEMAMVAGSLGILASASLGKQNNDNSYFGMYEPSGGSAPDIAGQGIANPIAQILSLAMMLNYSFNLKKEAQLIDNAVVKAINDGYRTGDIFTNEPNLKKVNTTEMGDAICSYIK